MAEGMASLNEKGMDIPISYEDAGDSTPTHEKLWTADFTSVALVNLFVVSAGNMLLAALPFYIRSLGGSSIAVGLASFMFAVLSFVARPTSGWLLDNKSRRTIYIISLIGVILVPPLYILLPFLGCVVFLRGVQGLVHATAGTASNTNAVDMLPKSRFGEGMGYFGVTTSLSTMIGPALGLFIWNTWGLKPLFLSISCLGLISLLLVSRMKLRKITPRAKDTTAEKQPWYKWVLNLFDKRALPASILMMACLPGGAVTSFIALFAADSGLGNGGTYFMCQAIGTVAMRAFTGRFSDRYGEGPSLYIGCGFFLLGILLIVGVHSTWMFYLGGILFGFGYGFFCPAMQVMAVRIVPPERRGAAISTYLCSWDICLGLGGLLGGLLHKVVGYRPMFCILSLAVVACVLLYKFWGSKTPAAFKVAKQNNTADF